MLSLRRSSVRPPSSRSSLFLFAVLALAIVEPARGQTTVRDSGSRVARRVAEQLRAAALGPLEIAVTEAGGGVKLTGWVTTLHARERVAAIAERQQGVRSMSLSLQVRPSRSLEGVELERAVRERLRGVALRSPTVVDVSVEGRAVRLAGSVGGAEDKYAIEESVRGMDGPVAVVNELAVDSKEGLRRAEVELLRLFERREVRVEGLKLSRRGDSVVLDGRAYDVVAESILSEAMRELAGSGNVVNQIVLTPQ